MIGWISKTASWTPAPHFRLPTGQLYSGNPTAPQLGGHQTVVTCPLWSPPGFLITMKGLTSLQGPRSHGHLVPSLFSRVPSSVTSSVFVALILTPISNVIDWVRKGKLFTQSCLILCDPMDCSPPGFSVHGILQARILEGIAISFFRGSSPPRDQTWVSHVGGTLFTN